MDSPESAHSDPRSPRSLRFSGLPVQSWLWLVGALAAGLIVGMGTLGLAQILARPLAYLVISFTIAAALAPVVAWLERRMPRRLAVSLVYLAIILLIGGFLLLLSPALASQTEQLGMRLPSLIQQVQETLRQWSSRLGIDFTFNDLSAQVGGLSNAALRLPLAISSGVFNFLLVLFVSFYMLLEAPGIRKFLISLFPPGEKERAVGILGKIVQAMGGYLRGTALTGVVMGLITTIMLLLIGIDFAFVLGALAGLLELIPVAGPILAGVIILAVTLASNADKFWIVLVFLVVVQQLENNFLVPKIMQSQTRVSSLLVLVALFIGQAVGGLLGALVAIPLAAALRVFVREVVAPAIRKATGAESQPS